MSVPEQLTASVVDKQRESRELGSGGGVFVLGDVSRVTCESHARLLVTPLLLFRIKVFFLHHLTFPCHSGEGRVC